MYGTFPDLISSYLYLFGSWEPDATQYLYSALRNGGIFVDIGANIGYFTLTAATILGRSGRVIAIEPSTVSFDALTINIAANKNLADVRCLKVAAGALAGEAMIYEAPPFNRGMTTMVPGWLHSGKSATPVAPLTELLKDEEIKHVRLIKIDVEGSEPEVLKGLLGLVDKLPQDAEILVEVCPLRWPSAQHTLRDMFDPFIQKGFNIYRLQNDALLFRMLWPEVGRMPRRIRKLPARNTFLVCELILSRRDVEVL